MIEINHKSARECKKRKTGMVKVKRKKLFKGNFKYFVDFTFQWSDLYSKKYDIRYSTNSLKPYKTKNTKKRVLKDVFNWPRSLSSPPINVDLIDDFLNDVCCAKHCTVVDWRSKRALRIYFEEYEDIVLLHIYLNDYIYSIKEIVTPND